MFSILRPSPRDIARFLAASRDLPLSYQPVGLALAATASFDADETIVALGSGPAIYKRAKQALGGWTQFDLGWVELYPRHASIEVGSVVAVLIRHLGFWSLNGCRVVYAIGNDVVTEFGYAYGTLSNHGESGEEVFKVTMNHESGEVSYVIRAASRPRAALARLGYPLARHLQARFRRDSALVMQQAVRGITSSSRQHQEVP
jgi:uncharacterized protein (UPF0548 family)